MENVVATARIADDLPMASLPDSLGEGTYDPKRFPGIVLENRDPLAQILLFPSGKAVCTGTRSPAEARRALLSTRGRLRRAKVARLRADVAFTVQNILASTQVEAPLRLRPLVLAIGPEHVEYDAGRFPALVYHVVEPRCRLIFFESGRIVCTGLTDSASVRRVLSTTVEDLAAKGVLTPTPGSTRPP